VVSVLPRIVGNGELYWLKMYGQLKLRFENEFDQAMATNASSTLARMASSTGPGETAADDMSLTQDDRRMEKVMKSKSKSILPLSDSESMGFLYVIPTQSNTTTALIHILQQFYLLTIILQQ